MNIKRFVPFLQGFVMGVAEIIPGVSGSTLALIMGIYSEFIDLLHSISDVVKEFLKWIVGKASRQSFIQKIKDIPFGFAIKLGLGMVIAIAILSNVIKFFLETYPNYVDAFFFGLILASVLIPWKEMTARKFHHFLIMGITAVILFIILSLNTFSFYSFSPNSLHLFFGGVVGISGLILPGVSGSFILVLLGLYDYVISILRNLFRFNLSGQELFDISIFVLGLFIGFLGFVRIVKYGFNKYPNIILSFIIGLMLGSLRVIYPFVHRYFIDDVSQVQSIYFWPWESSEFYNIFLIWLIITLSAGGVLGLSWVVGRKD